MTARWRTLSASALLAGMLCVLAACTPGGEGEARPPGGGHPLAARPTGGDFTLQGPAGPVDTRALRGKVLLVYFGYANCPDVCPASLAVMNQMLREMDERERARIVPLMISVDPERDTPQTLREYTAYFHPDLLGVTGTPGEIASVAKAFGAGYARQPTRPDGGYAIDHSANTYVVGPDGQLAATLPLGAPHAELLAAVRKLL